MKASELKTQMQELGDPQKAQHEQRFFKTYDGGYGAGDKFLGLNVPTIRAVAGRFKDMPLSEVAKLLASPIHEHRQAGLVIITNRAKKADAAGKKEIHDFYMAHLARVDNWDLVDLSCPTIVGTYLVDKDRSVLYKMAHSKKLWEKRIAMVSTLGLIRAGELADTFLIAEILLADTHDLIHKAVGWMLRCAGDVDRAELLNFLDKHAHELPRTALRYSLEHLSPTERLQYMQQKA